MNSDSEREVFPLIYVPNSILAVNKDRYSYDSYFDYHIDLYNDLNSRFNPLLFLFKKVKSKMDNKNSEDRDKF